MPDFLLALDFDGVVCDGLQEYFQVAWRTYCHYQYDYPNDRFEDIESSPYFESFSRCRAVIETGWEMPLLIQALIQNRSEAEILDRWSAIVLELLQSPGTPSAIVLAAYLDQVRDRWIREDLSGWLSLHRFYPGILPWLNRLIEDNQSIVIVSTKEGRFIHQLLQQANLKFPTDCIFGKEVKQPKAETLRQLMLTYPQVQSIGFVEDRFATLESIKTTPDLEKVQLYLADWGYNTAYDRSQAALDDRIQLLTLGDLPDFPKLKA